MPEAVLVSALRTPVGTAFKGTLRDTTAYDLAHRILTAAASGLDPALIDDVILGEGLYGGGVVARHAFRAVMYFALPKKVTSPARASSMLAAPVIFA